MVTAQGTHLINAFGVLVAAVRKLEIVNLLMLGVRKALQMFRLVLQVMVSNVLPLAFVILRVELAQELKMVSQ